MTTRLLTAAAAALLLPTAICPAQDGFTEAGVIEVDTDVSAVTVYLGRASATRRTELAVDPGVYDLRFTGLPRSIDPRTLQARGGSGIDILAVEFEEVPATAETNPALAALDAEIADTLRQLAELESSHRVISAEEEFLDSIAERATGDAGASAGSGQLDLDAVRAQLRFLSEEKTRVETARREIIEIETRLQVELAELRTRRETLGGGTAMIRTAVVSIVAVEPVESNIELTYQVTDASWAPVYNIRATADGTGVRLEYEAVLRQGSGEDWNDVALTLSTAQPTLAATPPALRPWFVDSLEEDPPRRSRDRSEPMTDPSVLDTALRTESLGQLSNGLTGGPSITYELARLVTVKTDFGREQRTRIASVDTNPRFVHVAVPLETEQVHIRGELTNASDLHLLPGEASVFVGRDYIGPTQLPGVPPRGAFELYFGVDPAVTARRVLVNKKTSKTGLLAGGRQTLYDYRIDLKNGSGKSLTLELWDRYPVSRSEQIRSDLLDLSVTLATDEEYVEQLLPTGLLKWLLNVPGSSTGTASFDITWSVRVNRDKDVVMTPLPE